MDERVLATQRWLNKTYGNDSRYVSLNLEDEKICGKTGWKTIYALTRALQIELGIQTTADNFGPSTRRLFSQRFPSGVTQQATGDVTENNIYGIIQGALWCKGYVGGGAEITPHFYATTASGVKNLKEDAGLSTSNATVSLNLMKALLSMDQFVLLKHEPENIKIQVIQRQINATYENYIGLIPCDGLYGRQMNEALIKVLQAVEGLSPSEATGTFGPTTKRLLPILPDTSTASAVKLFRWCMVCNGYDNDIELGTWNNSLSEKVKEMQAFHVLPITGKGDVNTWMSLLLSKGNPDRSAIACDASTVLNYNKALSLYNAGYRYIGRYLTGTVGVGTSRRSKAMTRDEMSDIFRAGLRIFAIFQEGAPSLSRYTYAEGLEEGQKAIAAALNLGIPESAIIYFAIDYDVMDGEVGLVQSYFIGVNSAFVQFGYYYKIGIYGARNVCSKISASNLAISSFISDMSTGFSGNMGYTMPSNWAFDQFNEYSFSSTDGAFDLDKVAYSGRYSGFDHITAPNITLPDVSDEYRYQRARDFLAILGINLTSDFQYGVKTEIDAGYFAIRYQIHKNITITEDSQTSWGTYDVTNGVLSVSLKEMMDGIHSQLGTEITTNIGFTDASMVLNAILRMQNGTIKLGVKLNAAGELIIHIIAKEILRQSGPATYSQTYEIEYVFRTTDTLTPAPQPEYAYAEAFSKIDWEDIVTKGTVIILIVSVAALLLLYGGGLAGIIASGITYLSSLGAQQILVLASN